MIEQPRVQVNWLRSIGAITTAIFILQVALPVSAQATDFKVRFHFRGLVDLVAERDGTAEELFVLFPETRFGKFSEKMSVHSVRIYYHKDNGAGGSPAPNCFDVSSPTEWRYQEIHNLHIEPLATVSSALTLDRGSIGDGQDATVHPESLEWLADLDKEVLDWPSGVPHQVVSQLLASAYSPVGPALITSRFRFSRGAAFAGEFFKDTDDRFCRIVFGGEERYYVKEFIVELDFRNEATLIFRNLFSASSYYPFTLVPVVDQKTFDVFIEHAQPCDDHRPTDDFLGHYKIRMNPERGSTPSECNEYPPPTENPQCSPAQSDRP